jgi:spermidine/putrescine transport system ATP-binding protein
VDRFVADFIGESNFLSGQLTTDGGVSRFRLLDGTVVAAPAPAAGQTNGHVSLMIRPEAVGVGREAPASAGSAVVIRGHAADVAFMGNHTRVTIETGAGVLVALRFRGDSDEHAIEEEMLDRDVHVWWDPRESAVVAGGERSEMGDEQRGGGVEG